ncbi:type IV pilus twitching motility protein PilT [Cerasicoccus frondis]|uniref:type IV pilus twitching motility protein PilT n=1 Tax=Cerasicoccus frondis TaxID=490090 RepID=UPI0028527450|nr:PilT/PilU family type 4a pilus ATPase [Cerasicoccus frondis]
MTSNDQLEQLLNLCIQQGASDVHLSSGRPASFRTQGNLQPHSEKSISAELITKMSTDIMTPRQREAFHSKQTIDIGYSTATGERFRINCYFEMGQPTMAIRHLDQSVLSLKELGLPQQLKDLAELTSGLVLVTGVTGSGKSTTLAVLIDEINRTRHSHILTVEDPVEFVHQNQKSLIHHREVGTDVPSFAEAVRAGLRQDPDVILVGELRDRETMQTAIIAAETGHLVFSTLHTGSAVGAVERFIGAFSGHEQAAVRHRFSMVLRAVIAQQLIPDISGKGRLPAVEILKATPAVAHMIRSSKTEQLYALMESGSEDGMWTVDQALTRLLKEQKITIEVAMRHCNNLDSFQGMLASNGRGAVSWQ